ncbi:proteophosphoglycan ppg4 [Purpureocillium lavendulum]|uniref:Proteophosphoglycan ppg4 n=1 Tax=Purpureocillium lavendulum TaxID=1247861 RepID=A0AB34FYD5_9HYPO|nr:proteophosphoglycan ppg4 [Purpureocillium lavendulum]
MTEQDTSADNLVLLNAVLNARGVSISTARLHSLHARMQAEQSPENAAALQALIQRHFGPIIPCDVFARIKREDCGWSKYEARAYLEDFIQYFPRSYAISFPVEVWHERLIHCLLYLEQRLGVRFVWTKKDFTATAAAPPMPYRYSKDDLGGSDPNTDDQNTNLAVRPLYDLPKSKWWMQADRGCDKVPPPSGEFLELPAGKSFMTELANNRAFTSLSYGGSKTTEWQDGENRAFPWRGPGTPPGCLGDNPDKKGGELHTHSIETTGGTAWAISYETDLSKVSMDNLVVFSVRYYSPFFRETWYDVPADLPACPEEGCYCAWLWIPDGCGEPNMYMQNHRCKVTGSSSSKRLATPKAPVWCKDDPSKCVTGAKQMMAWHQAEGNNVDPPNGQTPTYNQRMGFMDGAQNDIFE